MSLNEILEAIPKLSFAERQQLVRRAIEADDDLKPNEEAVLEERLRTFELTRTMESLRSRSRAWSESGSSRDDPPGYLPTGRGRRYR